MRCKFIHFYTYLYLLVAVPPAFCDSGIYPVFIGPERFKNRISYFLGHASLAQTAICAVCGARQKELSTKPSK